MTEQAKDYINRWEITYNPKTDWYEMGSKQFDEDEIEVLAKYDIDADTEINVLAIDSNDTLDYLDGFDNGLHNLYYEVMSILRNTTGITDKMLHEIITKMSILEMDYTSLAEAVKADILQQMECHEASKHFEDYMNEPESQMSDIEICRNNHPQRNGDCAFCTEVCCPQSSVNEV